LEERKEEAERIRKRIKTTCFTLALFICICLGSMGYFLTRMDLIGFAGIAGCGAALILISFECIDKIEKDVDALFNLIVP